MKQSTEFAIQCEFVKLMRYYFPSVLFSISPQGMKLNIVTATNFKRMGYNKGTPDITIYEPRGGFHGLTIEFKKPGGKQSKEQKQWETELINRGYMYEVCDSASAAYLILQGYMKHGEKE